MDRPGGSILSSAGATRKRPSVAFKDSASHQATAHAASKPHVYMGQSPQLRGSKSAGGGRASRSPVLGGSAPRSPLGPRGRSASQSPSRVLRGGSHERENASRATPGGGGGGAGYGSGQTPASQQKRSMASREFYANRSYRRTPASGGGGGGGGGGAYGGRSNGAPDPFTLDADMPGAFGRGAERDRSASRSPSSVVGGGRGGYSGGGAGGGAVGGYGATPYNSAASASAASGSYGVIGGMRQPYVTPSSSGGPYYQQQQQQGGRSAGGGFYGNSAASFAHGSAGRGGYGSIADSDTKTEEEYYAAPPQLPTPRS